MKSKMTKIYFSLAAVFCLAILAGCYTPSPLYGTWSDNTGNTISFLPDNTYNAKIKTPLGPRDFTGEWQVQDNILIITSETGDFVTEWDIRGAILYLSYWLDVDTAKLADGKLTLFHISK